MQNRLIIHVYRVLGYISYISTMHKIQLGIILSTAASACTMPNRGMQHGNTALSLEVCESGIASWLPLQPRVM